MSKLLVSDALWTLIAPLLPPELPKPEGGHSRSGSAQHFIGSQLGTARRGCWHTPAAVYSTAQRHPSTRRSLSASVGVSRRQTVNSTEWFRRGTSKLHNAYSTAMRRRLPITRSARLGRPTSTRLAAKSTCHGDAWKGIVAITVALYHVIARRPHCIRCTFGMRFASVPTAVGTGEGGKSGHVELHHAGQHASSQTHPRT